MRSSEALPDLPARAYSRMPDAPPLTEEELAPEPAALALLPAAAASELGVLPLALDGPRLRVAVADLRDFETLDAARAATGRPLRPRAADPAALADAIDRAYGSHAERMIAGMGGAEGGPGGDAEGASSVDLARQLEELAREPTVVNLVNLLLHDAVQAGASDVHIEPFEKKLLVKYRIDGLLHPVAPPPWHLRDAVTSRIKVIAGLDIAERFLPQDGHIDFELLAGAAGGGRRKVDLRVSTVPTVHGESVVMRILDRASALKGVEELGLDERRHHALTDALAHPHGIFLVTGPTGSGKSTTLYAALQHLHDPTKKVLTIEDPVEYELEGVNQIPVNPKRGLGFADGLRAILRQDPDVVMIGEIRDRETAEIAIRAALTGHLVLSTLHTNDAAGAVNRLVDMGVEPFLVASSLRAVLAQRLVRKVCEGCRREAPASPALLRRLGHLRDAAAGRSFWEGAGCRACRAVGYRGRRAVFELLPVTEPLREAINRGASVGELRALFPEHHVPMIEDGYRLACEGVTTLDEVVAVAAA